ncbi:MAG: hypothetical protein ACTHNP_02345 [Solirubrobacterales bacterium]
MAQTKTQKKRSPRKAVKPSSKSKTAKKAAKPKAAASKSQSSNGARSNGSGSGLGKVVSKAKLPLVAGGAAVAGAAGGLALASSKQAKKSRLGSALTRKPQIKVNSGDLAKAAKEVGDFSAQVGKLANGLQRALESADGKRRLRR